MRPQDLLHLVNFDFKLIPGHLHYLISDVQISASKDLSVIANVIFSSEDEIYSFILKENKWEMTNLCQSMLLKRVRNTV